MYDNISVTVVIAAGNEADNLKHLLTGMPDTVDEVILVGGRSTDGNPDMASPLRAIVRVIQHEGRWKADALRAGCAAATGEVIVTLDTDGSTDPLDIPMYVGALLAGAGLDTGSNFAQGRESPG